MTISISRLAIMDRSSRRGSQLLTIWRPKFDSRERVHRG
jgi:hypothetical protein